MNSTSLTELIPDVAQRAHKAKQPDQKPVGVRVFGRLSQIKFTATFLAQHKDEFLARIVPPIASIGRCSTARRFFLDYDVHPTEGPARWTHNDRRTLSFWRQKFAKNYPGIVLVPPKLVFARTEASDGPDLSKTVKCVNFLVTETGDSHVRRRCRIKNWPLTRLE